MNPRFYAVIMAGGRGERFWPLSTARRPKQLLSLVGGKPLLTQAVERLGGLIPPSRVFIVTNRDLVRATRAAAPRVPKGNVIGEPVGRDTAAAVAVGGALVRARDPDGVFCVLTADHFIKDAAAFRKTLSAGLQAAAASDVLVTIGIRPTGPNTGYGYIEAGVALGRSRGVEFLKAKRFVEKPDAATARRYLRSGRYCWNSGMFVWSVAALLNAFERHRPALARLMDLLTRRAARGGFAAAMEREYRRLEKISIDYALMEKADNIVMARGRFAWDDVGSWTAMENYIAKDAAGNAIMGSCEAVDSRGNLVVSDGRLTALVGVSGLIVVQAGGATLVCRRDDAQRVKELVRKLGASGRHGEVL